MKRALLATLVLFAALTASAAELTETIDRTFDVRPGANVVLTNVNGSVRVTAWDQPRVRVVARKEVRGDRDELREALKSLRVDLQPKNGGLDITTHHPKHDGSGFFDWILGEHVSRQVTYDVTVPRNMNLEVSNTNGSIRLSGITGKHELETTNGKINVDGCGGSLDASTTNGSIHAELTNVTRGQPLSFHTTNGRIELTVPANLAADLDAGTTNGSINSDLPVATTRVSRTSLRGSVNGGGTPLRMRTTNGGIEIRTLGKS